ncbi:COG1470 family protein [Chryseobacterium indoltheticum]|uniref:COG1470 family protein n=1 Tax=Chryseobacterium indoltheticum TaxID=254 RepID=UPI003F49AF43
MDNLFYSLIPGLYFSQKKDSLKPGTSTSISFTIENKGSVAKTYNLKAESSSNFIIPILKNGTVTISPNESKIYIVPLQIATETPQGKYSVLLQGNEITTGENIIQSTKLLVAGNRKLSLTLLDSPEFVKAGETIKSTFLLKNEGNVSENLILESKNAAIDLGYIFNFISRRK